MCSIQEQLELKETLKSRMVSLEQKINMLPYEL